MNGRILFIFTTKSLLYTAGGALLGFVFNLVLSLIGLGIVGIILMVVFALIGFFIGTFKVPNISVFEFTRQTAGEKIDDVIVRAIKFKMKKRRIYLYKEDKENGR